ncbi:putative zinc finger protein [Apostichopus japonicus]|uniref:Putative zinc finger protein n=1 Tax=Stichopus japonicus TaxID=307972 RepID=A0A2G8JKI5_STIJA|nr:putative zinc finger protein [Apostichopus japonicus]PIK39576.1 putative zinc finger protein [Apostichopus japonicus]
MSHGDSPLELNDSGIGRSPHSSCPASAELYPGVYPSGHSSRSSATTGTSNYSNHTSPVSMQGSPHGVPTTQSLGSLDSNQQEHGSRTEVGRGLGRGVGMPIAGRGREWGCTLLVEGSGSVAGVLHSVRKNQSNAIQPRGKIQGSKFSGVGTTDPPAPPPFVGDLLQ